MLSHGLKFFTDTPMTVIGLVLFVSVFVAVLVWTFSCGRSQNFYQKVSEQPLAED